ncbi:MAG: hypothetical protein COA41_07100 [Sphingopyxis sp.]|nr:MAG: hypothetical protein COA41_07100 [Sphingopyxis sp.]
MKLLSCLALFASIIFFPDPAHAWGKWGHVTICEYSYRLLTDDAKTELNRLMIEHPAQARLEANRRAESMTSYNYACLYADSNEYGKRVESPRHYLNLQRSEPSLPPAECPGDRPCILRGISEEFAVLRDTSLDDSTRADALVMLGHWIGDLHQPLHVSFKDDQGGNHISKLKEGRCSAKNLHAVWDTCILERGLFRVRVADFAQLNREKRFSSKVYRYVDDIESRYSIEQLQTLAKPWLETGPHEWAMESYQITRMPDVKYCIMENENCSYDTGVTKRPALGMRKPSRKAPLAERQEYDRLLYAHNKKVQIDDAYISKFAPVVETRLMQAAIRLADRLNTALDPNYNGMPDFD